MLKQGRTYGPRRLVVALVAVTVITLSTALAAFSYGGLAIGGDGLTSRDEPRTPATTSTAPSRSYPKAMRAGQVPKALMQELEKAPDTAIQFDNSSDAPLIIDAASIKAVKAPLSNPRAPSNRHLVSPDVQLHSAADKRITGLVLSFTCKCGADKTCTGEGGLDLTPGAEYRFIMKPQWNVFALYGDPNLLRVSVAAVLLDGEDLWVNVNETGVRLQGTLAVRSDSRFSKPSSPSEAASRRPEEAIQSERRASSVVSARIVTDAACDGSGCPLSLIKNLGEIIGLPVVFEAAAEVRLQSASAIYLRNLRKGDLIEIIMRLNNLKYSRAGNQLNVQYQNAPEGLYRLKLSN